MQISDLVIRVVILLLPGLLSITIIKALITKRKIENREFCVYTILLSFLSYFVLYVLISIFSNKVEFMFFKALLNSEIPINIYEVFGASLLSIFLAIIISLLINKGCFYTIMRKMRLTNRTGATSVWSEFIDYNGNGFNRYLYIIDLEKDIIYGGQVQYFSNDDSKNIELVLIDVVVTTNSNRDEVVRRLNSVYLSLLKENIIIEVGDEVNGKEIGKKRPKSKNR